MRINLWFQGFQFRFYLHLIDKHDLFFRPGQQEPAFGQFQQTCQRHINKDEFQDIPDIVKRNEIIPREDQVDQMTECDLVELCPGINKSNQAKEINQVLPFLKDPGDQYPDIQIYSRDQA